MTSPKHLYKSTDPVIAGVCGGIAEFFDIDPTFARVVAVVLLVASIGCFLLFYLVAMVVIPKNPAQQSGYINATVTGRTADQAANQGFGRPSAAAATGAGVAPGATAATVAAAGAAPSAASGVGATPHADPGATTGSFGTAFTPPDIPAAGFTPPFSSGFSYGDSPADYSKSAPSPAPNALKKRWSAAVCLGLWLICVGVLALLANLVNLSFWRLWPLAFVVFGLAQLFTPATHGWSLERAGGAFVMISFGLLAQAMMLGLVSLHAVMVTFWRVWPMLMVVLGLTILAGAKKQEIFSLLASLLFSATLLLGVWLFGGVGGSATMQLFDGSELVFELPASPMPPADEPAERFAADVVSFTPFRLEP